MSSPAAAPSSRLADILSSGSPVLFLSAHLDDAVLSCGALISRLVQQGPLTVLTIFTEASPPPHTRAASSFLRQCGTERAATLFAARRDEDSEVLTGLGAHAVHLGVTDALFRPREIRGRTAARLGQWLPELVYRYPTYRFDIAKGRLSRGDRGLTKRLTADVDRVAGDRGVQLVFCPVGIGKHVDHLIARAVGVGLDREVVYYSDFPYNLRWGPDAGFLTTHQLTPWSWDEGIADKEPLIRGYRTQADALFPDGRIPRRPEIYYERSTDR